jgi:hypothetical protein
MKHHPAHSGPDALLIAGAVLAGVVVLALYIYMHVWAWRDAMTHLGHAYWHGLCDL